MILQFGRFKGQDVSQIPDTYLIWLATKSEKDQLYKKPWETKQFTISFDLERAARTELHRRGWTSKGLRCERPE